METNTDVFKDHHEACEFKDWPDDDAVDCTCDEIDPHEAAHPGTCDCEPGIDEEEEEIEYDPSQAIADMIIERETQGQEYDPSSVIDEGVYRREDKPVHIPLWEREWEVTHPGYGKGDK